MVVVFLILALIIAILAVIFALQNASVVMVSVFSYSFEGSLALVLLLTFAAGSVAGILLLLPSVIKMMFRLRRLLKNPPEDRDSDFMEDDEDDEMEKGVKGKV